MRNHILLLLAMCIIFSGCAVSRPNNPNTFRVSPESRYAVSPPADELVVRVYKIPAVPRSELVRDWLEVHKAELVRLGVSLAVAIALHDRSTL